MPLSAEAGARTPATAERTNVTTAAVLIVSFWAAGTLSNLVLGGSHYMRIFSKSIFPWDPSDWRLEDRWVGLACALARAARWR